MKKFIKKAFYWGRIGTTVVSAMMPGVIRAGALPQSTAALPPGAVQMAESVRFPMRITAYTSSPEETDDTPFITANGSEVHDGIVATNELPFGTRVKIPEIFGEKVFVVEDRMNRRMKNAVDIWMSSKSAALRFGVNYAEVVVIRKTQDLPLE